MNTTDKFIYDQEIIDPLTYVEEGVKILTVSIKLKEQSHQEINSIYKLDKTGRIRTRIVSKGGWKAYPSDYDLKEILSYPKSKYFEEYNYVEDKLSEIRTYNNEKKELISSKNFLYENDLLKKEIEDTHQTEYKRNKGGVVIIIEKNAAIVKDYYFRLTKNYELNQLQQICKKSQKNSYHPVTIITNESEIEMKDELIYNPQGQLTQIITTTIFEETPYELITLFIYLDKESDLIESFTKSENGKFKENYRFSYNSENQIIKTTFKSHNGTVSETLYDRAYYH